MNEDKLQNPSIEHRTSFNGLHNAQAAIDGVEGSSANTDGQLSKWPRQNLLLLPFEWVARSCRVPGHPAES